MIRMPRDNPTGSVSPRAALLALALATTLPAFAQDAAKPDAAPEMTAEQKAMMEAYQKAGAVGEPHAALKKMEGDYDLVIKSWEGPGEPMVGNDPVGKGKITARMTSKWTDANTEVFEMFTPGPDGKEMKMMEITYTRRAK